jgi:hypothetical protein
MLQSDAKPNSRLAQFHAVPAVAARITRAAMWLWKNP